MGLFEQIISSLAAGGVAGLVIIWLAKKLISERIAQSIKNEYQRNLEAFKNELKLKSDFEGLILNGLIDKYWSLGEMASKISHDSTQLVARVSSTIISGKKMEKDYSEILKEINTFFEPESSKILESSMSLKKYYVLLPDSVIQTLQEFETSIWKILKEHRWQEGGLLTESLDKLLISIRTANASLLCGDKSLSDVIVNAPPGGFTPQYIKEAFSDKKPNKAN